MSKVVVAAAVSVLAFILGIIGAYMAMPSLDPERVEETHRILDSLSRADTTLSFAQIDSLIRADTAARPVPTPEPAPEPDVPPERIVALEDSLTMLREELKASKETLQSLQRQVQAMQQRWSELERRRQEASRLSGTLTKLEDAELGAVLEQLDLSVLEMLYIEASGRNRTRLLQAMPPERAALVVRKLVNPEAPETAPPPADTVSTGLTSAVPGDAGLATLID
ncbi:MAG: hypothetical protein D6685_19670 [Bacteroidetes bacterium]|nr:hypothetical protein AWN76_017565 [Rhodothermaceae bacterium RA]RMH49063.1 MAG: hypothetical protein D6685_19670 [Bacteroidota bacterium]